jgi:hypothetical protein
MLRLLLYSCQCMLTARCSCALELTIAMHCSIKALSQHVCSFCSAAQHKPTQLTMSNYGIVLTSMIYSTADAGRTCSVSLAGCCLQSLLLHAVLVAALPPPAAVQQQQVSAVCVTRSASCLQPPAQELSVSQALARSHSTALTAYARAAVLLRLCAQLLLLLLLLICCC